MCQSSKQRWPRRQQWPSRQCWQSWWQWPSRQCWPSRQQWSSKQCWPSRQCWSSGQCWPSSKCQPSRECRPSRQHRSSWQMNRIFVFPDTNCHIVGNVGRADLKKLFSRGNYFRVGRPLTISLVIVFFKCHLQFLQIKMRKTYFH